MWGRTLLWSPRLPLGGEHRLDIIRLELKALPLYSKAPLCKEGVGRNRRLIMGVEGMLHPDLIVTRLEGGLMIGCKDQAFRYWRG